MSFRTRQKLNLSSTCEIFTREENTLETGEVVANYTTSAKEMPDPKMFDLKNLIDAGVNIEEVNSKVLQPKHVNFDDVMKKVNPPKKEKSEGVENNEG